MTPSTVSRAGRAAAPARCGWAVVAAALVAGCASSPASKPWPSVLGRELAGSEGRIPRPLQPYVAADQAEGARNTVLHAMHAGKQALDIGATSQGRSALDVAYQRIETIYADNPAAAKARSTFVPESNKDFKGEPYERAMVGYYLGLADLLLGDPDNARAAFRWGEFQDTMSAAEQYQGDMASLRFLVGWVDHCQRRGTSAKEAFELARQLRPPLQAPAADDNLLLILEAGPAPRKTRSGPHGEELSYAPAAAPELDATVEFELDGRRTTGALAEDVYWQATTLGGRQVDKILAGKATFKENATTVARTGSAVTAVALDMARVGAATGDRNTLNVAGFGALAGLAMSIVGSATAAAARPEADIRSWSNLPGALFFATARVDPARAGVLQAKARAPAVFGNGDGAAPLRPVPGTPCFVARVPAGAGSEAWNPRDTSAWVAIEEAERTPPKAGPGSADPAGPPRAPVKTAPVRASF